MSAALTFGPTSTADEVATGFAEEIKGKNVLVTGTSLNGIGFETARVIAKYANLIIITGHNPERLRLAEEAIKADVPSANICSLTVDLGSLADVRRAAADVNARSEPLHVLIHNAAGPIGAFKLTAEGLENQMAVGHLGPFLLTKLLLPKIRSAATETYTPRVVFVAARAHRLCNGVDIDTLAKLDEAAYNSMNRAAQVKCANILTASEMARRGKGVVNAYSLHPGMIFTNVHNEEGLRPIFQAAGLVGPDGLPIANPAGDRKWKTIPQGAATTIAAAFDPRLDPFSGAYLDDCAVATETVAAHSADPVTAAKLWAATEEIIGEKLAFDF
ncbi:Short-chain dehydrogenase/reductase family protein [Mycena sanguinolenta]|uniref:Short-chain dehydrogenase/reductase family protein n=1 Tax=Mycena sanguinolenta TaxID=230812 RepID=A0A8H6XYG1_9AGAR|nr:Short-chain dehydrogenase/reductase family protein [Mycena sanguinolenta]